MVHTLTFEEMLSKRNSNVSFLLPGRISRQEIEKALKAIQAEYDAMALVVGSIPDKYTQAVYSPQTSYDEMRQLLFFTKLSMRDVQKKLDMSPRKQTFSINSRVADEIVIASRYCMQSQKCFTEDGLTVDMSPDSGSRHYAPRTLEDIDAKFDQARDTLARIAEVLGPQMAQLTFTEEESKQEPFHSFDGALRNYSWALDRRDEHADDLVSHESLLAGASRVVSRDVERAELAYLNAQQQDPSRFPPLSQSGKGLSLNPGISF